MYKSGAFLIGDLSLISVYSNKGCCTNRFAENRPCAPMFHIRLLIVDDHAFFVRSLMPPLEEDERIEIVGVARSGDEALALARSLRPDVITMDLNMPYLSGLAAMERLEERGRLPGVLVLTGVDEPSTVWAAFAAGARGFLRKDQITDELLLSGIYTVASGGVFLDPQTFRTLQAGFPATPEKWDAETARVAGLSPEDQALLRYVALGLDNMEIAARLHLSPKTVSNRLSLIYRRLGVASRSQAILMALRAGLARLSDAELP
ncbi:MAG: DNA-binding response regulator [Caldilineae bacterium]|nr:MAG: DNA-binding response regulator [Caldilineae bacterium]